MSRLSCVVALGGLMYFSPLARAQDTKGVGGFQYYGITHVSWSYYEYTSAAATTSRNDLAATKFNWAGVLVTWYQPTIKSNAMLSTFNTPSDAAVTQAIQEFHDKGIKVMLKPHVDVNDQSWRGNIKPDDPDAWFANYTKFIVQYAQMAESLKVEMLCWWPSAAVPRAHYYRDFRKAIKPASSRQRLVGLELPFTSQSASAAAFISRSVSA